MKSRLGRSTAKGTTGWYPGTLSATPSSSWSPADRGDPPGTGHLRREQGGPVCLQASERP